MAPYIHKPTNNNSLYSNSFHSTKTGGATTDWQAGYRQNVTLMFCWAADWWSAQKRCDVIERKTGRTFLGGKNLFFGQNDFLSQLPFSSSFVRIRRTRRFVDRSFVVLPFDVDRSIVVLPFDLYQPAINEKLIGYRSLRDEFSPEVV